LTGVTCNKKRRGDWGKVGVALGFLFPERVGSVKGVARKKNKGREDDELKTQRLTWFPH